MAEINIFADEQKCTWYENQSFHIMEWNTLKWNFTATLTARK